MKTYDLTGKIFGNWYVIELDIEKSLLYPGHYWRCRCACGVEVSIPTTKLTKGYSRQCNQCKGKQKRIDITGHIYGSLTALKFDYVKNKKTYWLFKCVCGEIISLKLNNVRLGITKSCGCKHWYTKDQHCKWQGYGEIGLTIFNKLKYDAEIRNITFNVTIEYLWDLFIQQDRKCALSGLPIHFGKSHDNQRTRTASLDRINSSLPYIPGNVQWVFVHINIMKQSYDNDYFIELCKYVSQANL